VSLKVVELTGRLEETIDNSIKSVSGHEWDEDFITLDLLRNLRRSLTGIQLEGKDCRKNINWQSYKLKGTHETNFGDIALVVNISYKDGTNINGAAFLEAKKRDWRKTTFGAMRVKQARKILKNAPRAHYLLYDYEDITNFLNTSIHLDEMRNYYSIEDLPFSLTPRTRVVCVPLNLADSSSIKDTLLYRHGTPLSFMLAYRYFQGLDLEFDEASKQVATGFLKKFSLPKYVVKIDITEEGAELMDDELRINQAEYSQID
jgi:hypothetical protein